MSKMTGLRSSGKIGTLCDAGNRAATLPRRFAQNKLLRSIP
jgi:hypothetical protein